MESQVFGAFLTWGVLGLIALGTGIAAWKIIRAQHTMIVDITDKSTRAIENNTAAMNTLGERMTDVEGRLSEVEDVLKEKE